MAKQAERNEATTQTETVAADEFQALLKQSFKPRTERAATEVDNAISTLVREALEDSSVVKSDVLDNIEEMIERLENRALPESAALSGRTVGPEPAVQAGLRVRVRSARRRAVRMPDRRLSF